MQPLNAEVARLDGVIDDAKAHADTAAAQALTDIKTCASSRAVRRAAWSWPYDRR
jgi:hypothetical protein